MRDPTERFSDRAEAYAKYRPGYPDDMLRFLEVLVAPPAAVADIGSGTGILTRELLKSGYDVWAVEPNEAMRTAAEETLDGCVAFRSVQWHSRGHDIGRSDNRFNYLRPGVSLVRSCSNAIGVQSNSEVRRLDGAHLERTSGRCLTDQRGRMITSSRQWRLSIKM